MLVIDQLHATVPFVIVRTAKELGLLARERRTALGWTQDALAQKVGVSRVWVVHFERGKPTTQLGLALRALKELGVTVNAGSEMTAGAPIGDGRDIDLGRLVNDTLKDAP